jgi:hypothetical protein
MICYLDTKSVRYTEVYDPEHIYTFTGPCIITGEPYSVEVKGKELHQFREKGCILQLKSLRREQREFLLTGVTPAGWIKLNGGFSVPAKP